METIKIVAEDGITKKTALDLVRGALEKEINPGLIMMSFDDDNYYEVECCQMKSCDKYIVSRFVYPTGVDREELIRFFMGFR